MLGNDRMLYRRGASQSATFVVAASDSLHQGYADYVCDGVDDQEEIQAAIDALPSSGGEIMLMEGTYTLSSQVYRAIDNVHFEGMGNATLIELDGKTPVISSKNQGGWTYSNIRTDSGGIDVNPAVSTETTNSMELIASIGESGIRGGHDVVVNGDYAYVASYNGDALVIINISDPANPTLVSTLTDTGHSPFDRLDGAHDILYANGYVFITKMIDQYGIVSVDVSDPENPVIADCLIDNTHLTSCHALVMSADKNYLYVGAYASASYFNIIDISDPTNMSIVSSLYNVGFDHLRGGVEVGNYVYMCAKLSNLIHSIDVSDKNNPVLVDSVASYTHPYNVAYDYETGYLYVTSEDGTTGWLGVYDFRDPTNLSAVSGISFPNDNENYVNYIKLDGKYVFLTQAVPGSKNSDILYCVDISDPTNPIIACSAESLNMDFAAGLYVDGNYIYVAARDESDTQLTIFRKSAYVQSESKLEYLTRDMTAESGDVSYTCGFRPTRLDAYAGITDVAQSIGHSDSVGNSGCIYSSPSVREYAISSSNLILLLQDSTNTQEARIKSYDDGGYTLTWTKTGSPTGTAYLSIRAIR